MESVLLTYRFVRRGTNQNCVQSLQIHFNCEREKERGEKETSLTLLFLFLLLHLQGKTENKTTAEMKNNSFTTERSTQWFQRLGIASKECNRPEK
jgi:hypothetical protein